MSPHLNLLMLTERLTICQYISGVYRYVYIYISLVQTIIKNVFTYTHNKHIAYMQYKQTQRTQRWLNVELALPTLAQH